MQLAFFEVVEVVACPQFPELVGQHGYVAGKSYENDDPIGGHALAYGVLLFSQERVISFEPEELKSTGYMLATEVDARGYVRPVWVDGAAR